MARPRSLKPAYCHHKATGRAFVKLDGEFVYLGDYGTQASRDAYDRVIGEWIARGRQPDPAAKPKGAGTPGDAPDAFSVTQLVHAFWTHAKGYYRNADGTPAGELENFRHALRPLKRLYGNTAAAAFGPLCLRAVRAEMLKPRTVPADPATDKPARTLPGWSRTYANRQIARVKQAFKWATENELVPPAVYHGLAAVAGLRKGKSEARETAPVRPVPEADVAAVLPHLPAQVRAMVELQSLTGMRPGEACAMRTADVDTTGKLWVYRPASHKTEHHGHERTIYLGPKAQAVLRPWLRTDLQAFIFSPAEAEAARQEKRRAMRNPRTPVQPSQVRRAEQAKRRRRRLPPGNCYKVRTYRQAIRRACKGAGVPPFHPHQLRHAAATRLRREFGLEAAQVILGHHTLDTTQVYAERNVQAALRIMSEVG